MSLLRFMMLSYLFMNFDKILLRLMFLVVYVYFSSLFFAMYYDGISSFVVYKNPINLFPRIYQIAKWYYYHREAITTGFTIRVSIIMIVTYFLQILVCRMRWGELLRYIFSSMVGKIRWKSSSRKEENGFSPEIMSIKAEFISRIEEHADDVITDILENTEELTYEDIAMIKKSYAIKIGFDIEKLIRDVNNNKTEED